MAKAREVGRKWCILDLFGGRGTAFLNGLDVGCERKRRLKDDSQVCGVSSWKDGAVSYKVGKECVARAVVGAR